LRAFITDNFHFPFLSFILLEGVFPCQPPFPKSSRARRGVDCPYTTSGRSGIKSCLSQLSMSSIGVGKAYSIAVWLWNSICGSTPPQMERVVVLVGQEIAISETTLPRVRLVSGAISFGAKEPDMILNWQGWVYNQDECCLFS
jgi:hypothetical protein